MMLSYSKCTVGQESIRCDVQEKRKVIYRSFLVIKNAMKRQYVPPSLVHFHLFQILNSKKEDFQNIQ